MSYCTLQYLKCLENIELNLKNNKLEINKYYNIFYKDIRYIKANIDKIYKNILKISPKVIDKNENIQDMYELFFLYFEYIRKYVNNMKVLNNIEIDVNILNKIKFENIELYNKIKSDGEKLLNVLNEYIQK